jgi:hypothetical protein
VEAYCMRCRRHLEAIDPQTGEGLGVYEDEDD